MSKEKTVELGQLLKKVYKNDVEIKDCLTFTLNEIKDTLKYKDEVHIDGAVGFGKCPACGGTIKKLAWGYGCSNYKTGCAFSISSKFAGKTLPEAQVKKLLEKGITDEINGFKSKEGKSFSAKLKVEDGKITFAFATPEKTAIPCPCCGESFVDTKWALKCACGCSIGHEVAGKKLSDKHIKQLCSDGVTEEISGFKSKAGKIFNAKLKLNKTEKKIEFLFK